MVYLFWWFTMIYLWKMVIFTANYQITRWQTMEKPRIVDRFPGKIDGWWMVMVDRPEEPKLIHPDWSNIGNSKQNWWVENPLETSWNQMKGLVFFGQQPQPTLPQFNGHQQPLFAWNVSDSCAKMKLRIALKCMWTNYILRFFCLETRHLIRVGGSGPCLANFGEPAHLHLMLGHKTMLKGETHMFQPPCSQSQPSSSSPK